MGGNVRLWIITRILALFVFCAIYAVIIIIIWAYRPHWLKDKGYRPYLIAASPQTGLLIWTVMFYQMGKLIGCVKRR